MADRVRHALTQHLQSNIPSIADTLRTAIDQCPDAERASALLAAALQGEREARAAAPLQAAAGWILPP